MNERRHYVLHAIIALIAVVALVLVVTGTFSKHKAASSAGAGYAVTAQQNIAESAAVTKNPNCAPPVPAQMGACAPRQALSLAQAIAPQGDQVPVHKNSSGAVTALFEPESALAAGPVDRGVDWSSYQGCSTNWSTQLSVVHFLVAKDDEGPLYHDKCFNHNITSAHAAHLPVGSYYFARNYMSPFSAADRQARDDRANGYDPRKAGNLPSTLDTESNDGGLSTNSACGWIRNYITRYEQDTGRKQMFLYSSQGTYAGCTFMPPGTYLWDAAYGPVWNVLGGFPYVTVWQYSDGTYGPTPHLYGSDSDIWLGSHSMLVSLAQGIGPQYPAVTRNDVALCGSLRWDRSHGYSNYPTTSDLRNYLVSEKVSCKNNSAQRYGYPPKKGTPAVSLFGSCRALIAWRNSGRKPAGYHDAQVRRNVLMKHGISCTPTVHYY